MAGSDGRGAPSLTASECDAGLEPASLPCLVIILHLEMETVCDSVAGQVKELRDGLLVSFNVFGLMLGSAESHVPRSFSGEYVVQTFGENVGVHD